MISLTDLYALNSLPSVGDQTLRKVINSELTIAELRNLDLASLKKIFSTQKSLDSFKENFLEAQTTAENDIQRFESSGITIIDCCNKSYPLSLRMIEDYPIFLYCKGNTKLLSNLNNIAVIGTRECSEVGGKIARSTAMYFAEKGYTIVSGLAKGIDAIGHKAALDAHGKTIAVLIDVSNIYPKENKELAERILSNEGLLLSENRPGSFQGKNSFVLRDRIQSGLSLAIFPIETDIVGGTMHTVKYATKQNRLIFVPNILNSSIRTQYDNSVGSGFGKIRGINELIVTKQAFPYIKDDYTEIENRLQKLKKGLERSAAGGHPFDNDDDIITTKIIVDEKVNESTNNDDSKNTKIFIGSTLSNNLNDKSKESQVLENKAVELIDLTQEFQFDSLKKVLINLSKTKIELTERINVMKSELNNLYDISMSLSQDINKIENFINDTDKKNQEAKKTSKALKQNSLFNQG